MSAAFIFIDADFMPAGGLRIGDGTFSFQRRAYGVPAVQQFPFAMSLMDHKRTSAVQKGMSALCQ